MKRERKSFLKVLLVFMLWILLMGTAASAASPVASIGSKKYTSLEKALTKVKKGQTIKLLKNVVVPTSLELKRDLSYNLNLNKKSIKCTDAKKSALDISRGSVTISNGRIYGIGVRQGAKVTIKSGTYGELQNYGTTTIQNGTFTSKYDWLIVNAPKGKLTIKKGTFSSKGNTIRNMGTMTISGGKVTNSGANGVGIYNEGKLTVKSGTYSSSKGTTLMNCGSATISGGTFKSKDKRYSAVFNEKTLTVKGGTIANTSSGTTASLTAVGGSSTTISGGTVYGTKVPAILVLKGYKGLKITGGKVTCETSAFPAVLINESKSSKAKINQKRISAKSGHKVLYVTG